MAITMPGQPASKVRSGMEPNNLAEEVKTLPKDKDIYVYCT